MGARNVGKSKTVILSQDDMAAEGALRSFQGAVWCHEMLALLGLFVSSGTRGSSAATCLWGTPVQCTLWCGRLPWVG